ncbi:MAG: DUF3263 domain-containing protein [Salana multivorans]|uniref:DUF3263 domain-containing protein n=1 Tax=Salana multivorans TaxID=120377 RepID=UPI00095C2F46|nr:DUF3263 domain-containing protein [Salana multivorans]MBN8883575.1 DUF3263 domain-containing protein [Salana multivorans]OJX93926.1 MAG: hypothetical protein BGO96_00215 [Micrococcales bacterium 73-15]
MSPVPSGRVVGSSTGLSEREREMLDFESRPHRLGGAKEAALRAEFGVNETSYNQVLNALLDRPDALAYAPVVVNRLRRLRDARAARRRSTPGV